MECPEVKKDCIQAKTVNSGCKNLRERSAMLSLSKLPILLEINE